MLTMISRHGCNQCQPRSSGARLCMPCLPQMHVRCWPHWCLGYRDHNRCYWLDPLAAESPPFSGKSQYAAANTMYMVYSVRDKPCWISSPVGKCANGRNECVQHITYLLLSRPLQALLCSLEQCHDGDNQLQCSDTSVPRHPKADAGLQCKTNMPLQCLSLAVTAKVIGTGQKSCEAVWFHCCRSAGSQSHVALDV